MGISYRPDTNKWVVRIRNKKLNIDNTKIITYCVLLFNLDKIRSTIKITINAQNRCNQ